MDKLQPLCQQYKRELEKKNKILENMEDKINKSYSQKWNVFGFGLHTERSSVMLESSSLAFLEIQKLPTLFRALSIFSSILTLQKPSHLSLSHFTPLMEEKEDIKKKKSKKRKFLYLFSPTKHTAQTAQKISLSLSLSLSNTWNGCTLQTDNSRTSQPYDT